METKDTTAYPVDLAHPKWKFEPIDHSTPMKETKGSHHEKEEAEESDVDMEIRNEFYRQCQVISSLKTPELQGKSEVEDPREDGGPLKKESALSNSNLKGPETESIPIHPNYVCLGVECGLAFYSERDLERHINKYRGVKPLACAICSKGFDSKSRLNEHLIGVHKNELRCNQCDLSFQTKHGLKYHGLNCSVNGREICSLCKASFHSFTVLSKHMDHYHHNNPEPPVYETDVEEDPGMHPCTALKCQKVFASVQDLRNHRDYYRGLRHHTCPKCSKTFFWNSSLKEHILGVHENSFRCKFCDKSLQTRCGLKFHEKACYVNGRRICNLCKAPFFKRSTLLKHVSHFHD